MNRGYLALGAAAVLAAVIGLLVVLRKGDDAVARRDPGGHAERDPMGSKLPGAALGAPGINVTHPSARASSRPTELAGSGSAAGDYMIGGVRVRDHRAGDHAPVDLPPAIHPPGGRKISSQLTADIAQKLRAMAPSCATGVPPEVRGATPRLDGEILIAIKNQQATVTNAAFQIRGVTGASEATVKQCMEQKAVGVTTPAGDEPDVEGYAITLSLRLP